MKLLIAAFVAVALLSIAVASQDRQMREEPSEEMEEPVHEDLDSIHALSDQDDDEDQANEVAVPQAKLRMVSVSPTGRPPSGVRGRRRRVRRRPGLYHDLERLMRLYRMLRERYGFRLHRFLRRLHHRRFGRLIQRLLRKFHGRHHKYHGRHHKFLKHHHKLPKRHRKVHSGHHGHKFHHVGVTAAPLVGAPATPTPAYD